MNQRDIVYVIFKLGMVLDFQEKVGMVFVVDESKFKTRAQMLRFWSVKLLEFGFCDQKF